MDNVGETGTSGADGVPSRSRPATTSLTVEKIANLVHDRWMPAVQIVQSKQQALEPAELHRVAMSATGAAVDRRDRYSAGLQKFRNQRQREADHRVVASFLTVDKRAS